MPKTATKSEPTEETAAVPTKRKKTAPKAVTTMEQLVEEQGGELIPYRIGSVVETSVVHATSKVIYVDIGGIALGVIPEREMSTLPKSLSPGDTVSASIINMEDAKGHIVLSMRQADRDRVVGELRRSYEDSAVIEVLVADANKGGLLIKTGDFSGFLPVSQLASKHYPKVRDGNGEEIFVKLKELVGTTLKVKVINFEPKQGKLIFSEKAAGDKEQEERIKGIGVGDIMGGTISGIVDFGLFVQLENEGKQLEGLIHISEVAWGRVSSLDAMFEVGQKVKAIVVSTDDNRVSLSLKRLTPDPWKNIAKRYQEGQIVRGKVTRITPFGVFVKLDNEIDGLVHISELSDERVQDPADVLAPAQEYNFKILAIEPKKHRLGLSFKQADQGQKAAKLASPKAAKPATNLVAKTTGPKTTGSKTTKPAAKSGAAKKPAVKKTAAKKSVAKAKADPKTTKPAAKKTTTKKSA